MCFAQEWSRERGASVRRPTSGSIIKQFVTQDLHRFCPLKDPT